jgi:hypothetical protein
LRDFAIRNRLPHHWLDLESDPGAERPPLDTSVAGVFAAGDVRSGSVQRMAPRSATARSAIREVRRFLAGRLHAVRLAQTYSSSK